MTLFRSVDKKGQVAPFLILVAAVLILAIPATVLIGEAAFQRVRIANVADSAVISAASAFCRSLNQIKQISFGPGGLLVTYVGLQAFLLAKFTNCPCACPPHAGVSMYGWFPKGAPYATGFYINSMITSDRLFDQAEEIADEMPKELRINLWDRALGGGLVDEPKPFINIPYGDAHTEYNPSDSSTWDEIEANPEPDGRVSYINYDKYVERDTRYTRLLRQHKKDNPGSWYYQSIYSYVYNISREKVIPEGTPLGETSGEFFVGNPDCDECEGYFRAEVSNLPNSVEPEPQRMVMVYFYQQPKYTNCCGYPPCCCCYCYILPAFIPHPYAWIRRIDIDSTQFSLNLRKLVSFTRIPFFGSRPVSDPQETPEPREPTFEQTSSVRIQGSVWSGYEPKLVR